MNTARSVWTNWTELESRSDPPREGHQRFIILCGNNNIKKKDRIFGSKQQIKRDLNHQTFSYKIIPSKLISRNRAVAVYIWLWASTALESVRRPLFLSVFFRCHSSAVLPPVSRSYRIRNLTRTGPCQCCFVSCDLSTVVAAHARSIEVALPYLSDSDSLAPSARLPRDFLSCNGQQFNAKPYLRARSLSPDSTRNHSRWLKII